ncbi:MAG TPA: c-type cytochrome, partial [Anaerolineae bacterium]|nr:c-type cytochrome [Anaerolineae bacterium]
MDMRSRRTMRILMALLVAVLVAGGCAPMPLPTAAPSPATATEASPLPTETELPPTATALPATDTPTAPAPEPEPETPEAVQETLFPPEMPSAVRGGQVFDANCATCHGAAGDGSGLEGAADFTDLEFMRGEQPAEFFEAIRDGVAGTAMPAWGDGLTVMDIWDVLYYEWTFATSPQEIRQGRELFAANCARCHGADGDGSGIAGAADFSDQQFMANEDPSEFYVAVRDGVEGTAMPVWGDQLSEDQIWSLVNSVWTFAYDYGEDELPQPADTPLPTETPQPTDTPKPTSTTTVALALTPDPAVGLQLWQQKPCQGCHGSNAEGNIGPRLAGTGLSFDQILLQVRTGAPPMPAYSEAEVSELELQHITSWLRSLAPPTPTPIALPTFPTGALSTMWQHVNDMKVKCDFAKDLPERQAGDDAGRLTILKQYANEALQLGQAAIGQANQAINDTPDEGVRSVIRSVIDHTNGVIGHANTALGLNSFAEAWPHAAQMVYISRLDAWPLATQSIRDAGLAGTVQVRVTDPSGNPIPGAFVTVLTAHTPVGVSTDSSGRATIANVAAVPALQV